MMALSSPWLTVGEAAARLHRTEREVLALVFSGALESVLRLDHYEIAAESVQEYAARLERAESASELATRSGDVLAEHADKPTFTPWTAAEGPDAFRDRSDYEGDEQQ